MNRASAAGRKRIVGGSGGLTFSASRENLRSDAGSDASGSGVGIDDWDFDPEGDGYADSDTSSRTDLVVKYNKVCSQREAMENLLIKEQTRNQKLEENVSTVQRLLKVAQKDCDAWKIRSLNSEREVQDLSADMAVLQKKLDSMADKKDRVAALQDEIARIRADLSRSESMRLSLLRQLAESQDKGDKANASAARDGAGSFSRLERKAVLLLTDGASPLEDESSRGTSSSNGKDGSEPSVEDLLRQLAEKDAKIEKLSDEVQTLKSELEAEQHRSAEEAEDMTQAMAELRYELTEMLEEERQNRARAESASVARVQELEIMMAAKQEECLQAMADKLQAERKIEARETNVRMKEKQLAALSEDLRRRATVLRAQVGKVEKESKQNLERCTRAESRAEWAENKLRELGIEVPVPDDISPSSA